MAEDTALSASDIIAATQTWLETAVIGLNLCPFARAVHVHSRIRYCVSKADSTLTLLEDLASELHALNAAEPDTCETTLLIHPGVLTDFLEYNDFLAEAEVTLDVLGFSGKFQIASFHPQYQFSGTAPDAIDNYSNRSPYPTLHLLRESSIDRAVAAFPDAADIYERNIETLRRLGHAGWHDLWD